MGASERDRAVVDQPRPVWVDVSGHWKEQDWRPGILLEWRRVELGRDRRRWEGLVVWARGGGELPWSLNQQWMQQQYLRPMFDDDKNRRGVPNGE